MRAARYRLRFIPGVNLPSATYGGGLWGDSTYGQFATDPVASRAYRLIPWPAGDLADPSWIYRQGDVSPQFQVEIASNEGAADLPSITTVHLVLTSTRAHEGLTDWMFELTPATVGGVDLLTRDWKPDDLAVPGNFRAGVVVTFISGRQLSIPADDRHRFVVTPNSTLFPTIQPNYRWDEARWGFALWS